jgi:hypothetical protein
MRFGDDHFNALAPGAFTSAMAIRAAVARGICTDIGLRLAHVAMSATLSAGRLSFWPPRRFVLCDSVQDWWGYLVVRKYSRGSRWMLANLFRLDQLEAESPDIQESLTFKALFDPEVDRRLFPPIALNLVVDALPLVERTQAGAFNGRNVNEHISATTAA